MAVPMPASPDDRYAPTPAATIATTTAPAYQAYQILHFAFTVIPIVAGLDKFFHFLVNWDQYLAPVFARMAPAFGGMSQAHSCMLMVGVIEMIAGLIVAFKPKIGAPIVGLWLIGIIINLLMNPIVFDHAHRTWGLDIAARDFGLCLGAFALARLATQFDNPKTVRS